MTPRTPAGLALALAGMISCSGVLFAGMTVPVSAPAPTTTLAPAEAPGPTPAPAATPATTVAPSPQATPAAPAVKTATPTTVAPAAKPAPAPAAMGAAPTPPSSAGDLNDANRLLAEGRKYEGRAILTKLILASPEGQPRESMRRTLETINSEIFFNPSIPSPDCVTHVVQRGDTLANVCAQNKKDVYFSRLLMKINNISDERRVRLNQKLKVPQGQFSAVVQKHAHRLIVLLNGQYIKEYSVALGATATPTPEGRFVIDNNKMINPDWYAPDGKIIRYGEPQNILGTRWLGFKESEGRRGFGIHGTTDPASVGADASNGCIRMNNADVEEVFSMLMPEDVVTIVK